MKITITGAKGTIGRVLVKGLQDKYTLNLLDLPTTDVRNYHQLAKASSGSSIIIHLAWHQTPIDTSQTQPISCNNIIMADNVYKVAVAQKIPRVIMASSVHADDFYNWNKNRGLMSIERLPTPTSSYGATKVYIEALGRYYAQAKKLEVFCVRFGGVNDANLLPKDRFEQAVWLTHDDCLSLVRKCLTTKLFQPFVCFYGVSNSSTRIHDTSNPIGWSPSPGPNH